MATLVLTTVGTIVGGPIGGAIGAVLGQAVDQRIFAPKARHGPRLGDLSVQTSSYGSQIPKLFGTMRVAGTVIWATDLVETRTSSGGGKGQPKMVGYSYAANFAVALSSRKVSAVRRIWADGKLLRGAGGDFKTKIGAFRLHGGSDDQAADPLIASAEGIGLTPAYRGLAYAVFEDFQLEDYGNRIPSLSFEIEADAAPLPIGSIAAALSGGAIVDGGTPSLRGYAATGDSVRSAVEALCHAAPLTLAQVGHSLSLGVPGAAAAGAIRRADCSLLPEVTRRASGGVPGEVSLGFYDPARDHQAGLQRAFRDGPSPRADSRSVAASMGADEAKAFAEARLAWLWAARSTAKLRLGWRGVALRPGSVVTIEKQPGQWLVERWLLGPMSVDLELARLPEIGGPAAASSGRGVQEPDVEHGPTVLRLFDLPLPFEQDGRWLAAVAAGASPGWRRALVTASFDAGATWQDLGAAPPAAALGMSVNAPPAASAAFFDDVNSIEVELLRDGMVLEGRSDAALAGGANLAILGSELIQFGRAHPVGERRFRLSRLLRGRRGTEEGMHGHQPGETFALLEPGGFLAVPVPPGAQGSEALLAASGIGDDSAGVEASCLVLGEALRPPSPVHLVVRRLPGGDVTAEWTRRSRLGWAWPSGSDTPLGEERELYRVTLSSVAASRVFAVTEPFLLYTASEQAADGLAGPLAIAVAQVGTHLTSRAAEALLD